MKQILLLIKSVSLEVRNRDRNRNFLVANKLSEK
jgi:hypothetical protein